jgi:uncharacterized protein CbrC (UPF0167 family)
MRLSAPIATLVLCASVGAGASTSFDPAPWPQDLLQMLDALSDKYANFDWPVSEREIELTALFNTTRSRIKTGQSGAGAKSG